MDKMQEEFEVWCRKRGYTLLKRRYTLKPAETNCGIIIDGSYGHSIVQLAWESWQESRATLCVKLPSFDNGSLRGYGGDCEEARAVVDSVAESLEKAGVRYE